MTLQMLVLTSLAIPGLLSPGEGPSPLSVIPLKMGEGYRLHLTARINGS